MLRERSQRKGNGVRVYGIAGPKGKGVEVKPYEARAQE